jgi:lipopolysaccharide heptosyltransferase II
MNRILVVEVNWLGDCILTLPIFRALKEKFPSSYIGVMVPNRLTEIFEDYPYVDEVIEFDERTTHKGLYSKVKFIKSLKKKRFDTAILIHRSLTRAIICALAQIKTRIGVKRFKTSFILTKGIIPPHRSLHRGDYYFSLLEGIGINIKDKIPQFFIKKQDARYAQNLINRYREKYSYLVAINPSANWPLKRWPWVNFVQLINDLASIGCAVLLIGAQKDKDVVQKIKDEVKGEVVDLCGRTTLGELAGILQSVDILVTSDSGPAHLGAASGGRVLVLFGPTSPSITGPRGRGVYILRGEAGCKVPCYNLGCKDNICMKRITPQRVFLKVREILSSG